jgi:membrane protein DedA with SNARE-associated domain
MEETVRWLVDAGVGYPVIFVLLLGAGIGIPIPEDVPLITAGVMSRHGGWPIIPAAAACSVFVLGRDCIVYFLGKRYGAALLERHWLKRYVRPEQVETWSGKIRSNGSKVVFAGRWIPGVRAAVFFSAGVAQVPTRTFLLFDGLAMGFTTPFWVWLGARFADELSKLEAIVGGVKTGLFVAVLFFGGWFISEVLIKRARERARSKAEGP